MQSAYSWMGTRLHLVLEDDFANAYNRAQEKFFEAQVDYKAQTGSQWTGHETLAVDWAAEELHAFNKFGDFINFLVEMNGGSLDITQKEMTSDFLIKL